MVHVGPDGGDIHSDDAWYYPPSRYVFCLYNNRRTAPYNYCTPTTAPLRVEPFEAEEPLQPILPLLPLLP